MSESQWLREDEREGESLLVCISTSMAAGNTEEGLAVGDNVILKHKGDRFKFQNDTTFSKFQSGNQSDEVNTDISKSDADKCAILHISEENSCKLLLLASALENTGTNKKISDSKLQKHLFNSAKRLKLKEFKYDSSPSMHQCLFQSFCNQLVCFEQCGVI